MAQSVSEAMIGLLADAEVSEAPTVLWNRVARGAFDSKKLFVGLNSSTFVNQFEGHEQLTSKNGLAQTLANHSTARGYFPKTFDMDQKDQRDAFIVDFRRYAALNIVRQHLALSDKLDPGGYECSVDMLQAAMMTLMQWKTSVDSGGDLHRDIPDSSWQQLLRYSELSPAQLRSGGRPGFEADDLEWGVFPADKMAALAKLVRDVEAANPQAHLQFDSNAWILKPHSSSMGEGIWCMRSMPAILQHCERFMHCVVQKYVEQPLLLSGGRKFDFRQWVLVKSFEPLEVFLFSEPYCRQCLKPYDLLDLDNIQSHLSNWHKNLNGEDCILSLDQFKEQLKALSGEAITWEKDHLPQVKRIVLDVLGSAKKVVQRPESFHLYGFDFMLDAKHRLWLIEVNAYPGCDSARNFPFLRKMVRRMTRRMLDIVCLGNREPDGQYFDFIPLESGPSTT